MARRCPGAGGWHQRCSGAGKESRDLRHRYPHSQWDEWAAKTIPVPMVIGHEFTGEIVGDGIERGRFFPRSDGECEGHVVCGRCRNCLAGRRHLCAHTSGVGVNRPGASPEYIALPMTNVGLQACGGQRYRLHLRSIRQCRAHGAGVPVLGEDVLVTGAGPIGIMAAAVAKHAGARHVVITDVNPIDWNWLERPEVTKAVDTRVNSLRDVQEELDMTEGFDVGLEMSATQRAFREMLANMCHGGKIAMLGIPPGEISIDWNTVIFNMLTIQESTGERCMRPGTR